MSVLRRIVTSRLSQLIRQPGGMSQVDALAQASGNLESLRGESEAAIDAALEAAEAAAAAEPPDTATVYRSAGEIVEFAGAQGMGALEKAAYSLCELVDGLRETKRWSRESVAVHLHTMKLIRPAGAASAEAFAAVLDGLAGVVARTRRPAAA